MVDELLEPTDLDANLFKTKHPGLRFDYDEVSDSIIVFDFHGYVGTCVTHASLWNTIKLHCTGEHEALRRHTKMPLQGASTYVTPEERREINARSKEWQVKAAEERANKQKGGPSITLDDLDL